MPLSQQKTWHRMTPGGGNPTIRNPNRLPCRVSVRRNLLRYTVGSHRKVPRRSLRMPPGSLLAAKEGFVNVIVRAPPHPSTSYLYPVFRVIVHNLRFVLKTYDILACFSPNILDSRFLQ